MVHSFDGAASVGVTGLGGTQPEQKTSRDTMDQDDRVRGRADEMEDAATDEDFDESDDLDDVEDEEEGEGSF